MKKMYEIDSDTIKLVEGVIPGSGVKSVGAKLILFFLLSLFLFIGGCNGSDELSGTIGICNFDNRGYYIEFCRDADDRVLESFFLGEWYDFADNCATIDDFKAGLYYIVIIDEYTDENIYSETFYLDEGGFEDFIIDEHGNIEKS